MAASGMFSTSADPSKPAKWQGMEDVVGIPSGKMSSLLDVPAVNARSTTLSEFIRGGLKDTRTAIFFCEVITVTTVILKWPPPVDIISHPHI
jgi:hypothetical protein